MTPEYCDEVDCVECACYADVYFVSEDGELGFYCPHRYSDQEDEDRDWDED